MSNRLQIIAFAALLFLLSPLRADVQSAIQKVSEDFTDDALCRQEAANLVKEMPVSELLTRLLDISDNPSELAPHGAATNLICAINPFPFQELVDRLSKETNSYRKGDLLWLLHLGASQDKGEQMLSLASQQLGDERPGAHIYNLLPEERADCYELRVCDVAYKILVRRLKSEDKFPDISTRSSTLMRRNDNIDRLSSVLGIPAPSHAPVGQAEDRRVIVKSFPPSQSKPPPAEIPHDDGAWKWVVGLLLLLLATACALFVRRQRGSNKPEPG